MQNTRPNAITVHHLQRRAVVYIRSSVYSSGSVDQQVTQRDFALRWGWPIDTVEIINDDLGASGLDAHRPGCQRLIQMIGAEQVGLVLVTDLTRLSRSSADFERFLDLCRSTDTLLAVNGTVVARDVRDQRPDQCLKSIAALSGE